jgi:hypothetical protein
VRRDDARAGRNEIAGERDGCHAARGDDRAAPLLELGERRCQQIACRVTRARVVIGALLAKAAKGEGRTQVQRGHDAAGDIIALDAGAHGLRDLTGTTVGSGSGRPGR